MFMPSKWGGTQLCYNKQKTWIQQILVNAIAVEIAIESNLNTGD